MIPFVDKIIKKKVIAPPVCTRDELQSLVSPQVEGEIPCVVYVNSTRKRIYRDLDPSLIPLTSIARYYRGLYRHWLGLDEKGLYVVEPDSEIDDVNSPQSLAIVLQKFDALIPKAFPIRPNLMEKMKSTILIVFCFVELIVLFLIISQFMGG